MKNLLQIIFKAIGRNNAKPSLKTYEELLQDSRWKAKRSSILKRDNYTCQYCHRKRKIMHVHHRYYLMYEDGTKILPWEYNDNALITLCADCHKWYHSVNKPKCYTIK